MERKLTAILSADVKGYSRLMGEDEEATIRTLTAYRAVMTTLIQQQHGRVVDSPGDNLLAEFASVVDAVRCAVAIQQELKARNAELSDQRKMEFRIGINLGDVVVEGERLYGDGVNIAARLESLAEPGGICISGTVYEHVENKLALTYEYLGEQSVKNSTKPVRVWRVQLEPEAADPAIPHRGEVTSSLVGKNQSKEAVKEAGSLKFKVQGSKAKEEKSRRVRLVYLIVAGFVLLAGVMATVRYVPFSINNPRSTIRTQEAQPPSLPLPDKPSIVILPFVNMSGDPGQEYFSDGITEDITSDLSKLSGFFVIARNSAFTYKGKAVKIQDVSREMGVRYVLEGSVRKAGEQVRVTAQLIDGPSGGHV
jgi:TolB-like protein/class 3 adenylate cyclase